MIFKGTVMLRVFVAVAFVFCLCGSAHALELSEFYEYLSLTDSFDSIDDIDYVESGFTPDMTWDQIGKISCYVDIVGYTGLVREGNEYYIDGPARDCVYVVHDKKHHVATGIGSGWSVTSLDSNLHKISVTDAGVVVTVKVKLKYKHTSYKLIGFPPRLDKTVGRYTQVSFFTDTDFRVPLQYPSPGEYVAQVIVYNNTIKPKTVCEFNVGDLDIATTYTYFNESIKYNKYNFVLEYTEDKNFPYGNLTSLEQWEYITSNNELIYPFLESVWIPGSNFSEDDLIISVHTPYASGEVKKNIIQVDGFQNDICILDILVWIWYVTIISLIILLLRFMLYRFY